VSISNYRFAQLRKAKTRIARTLEARGETRVPRRCFARRIVGSRRGLDAAGAEFANYGAGNPGRFGIRQSRRSAAFPRADDNPRRIFRSPPASIARVAPV